MPDLPDLPDFPDLDPIEVLLCVAEGIASIDVDEARIVAIWVLDVWETVDRLLQHRRRCLEMTSDRLQQACITTWRATALFEANRVRRDLAVLTDEETARRFEEHFLSCFEVDPDYAKANLNIFEFAKLI